MCPRTVRGLVFKNRTVVTYTIRERVVYIRRGRRRGDGPVEETNLQWRRSFRRTEEVK